MSEHTPAWARDYAKEIDLLRKEVDAHLRANSDLVDKLHAARAEVARLRAALAAQDAELVGLRDALRGADAALKRLADEQPRISAEQPRTDAEWKAADRKKRIFDKTIEAAISIYAARFAALDSAIYAKQMPDGILSWSMDLIRETSIAEARAIVSAVVEAGE